MPRNWIRTDKDTGERELVPEGQVLEYLRSFYRDVDSALAAAASGVDLSLPFAVYELDLRPRRIQRKRVKGWRMPENTVSVCRPGIYGNPFPAGPYMTQQEAVDVYRKWWEGRGWIDGIHWYEDQMGMLMGAMFQTEPHPLRDHNVACWCKLCGGHQDGLPLGVQCIACDPCHSVVVLEIANP